MKDPTDTVEKLDVIDDYTPSQLSYITPVRSGMNGIYKNKLNASVAHPKHKSQSGVLGKLNRSIDGLRNKSYHVGGYDNMVSRKYSEQALKRGSIHRSSKDLINQSYDINKGLKIGRDMFDPITGGLL
jgi:hypothetical protein